MFIWVFWGHNNKFWVVSTKEAATKLLYRSTLKMIYLPILLNYFDYLRLILPVHKMTRMSFFGHFIYHLTNQNFVILIMTTQCHIITFNSHIQMPNIMWDYTTIPNSSSFCFTKNVVYYWLSQVIYSLSI